MNKLQLNKIVSFLILASMLLGAFAVPQVAEAKSDLVRFTFVNKSDRIASLRLYGSNNQFYYFLLQPGESKVYTPVRGVYRMSYFSCGQYINKELDLTQIYTFVVPKCGFVAYNGKTPPQKIDGGKVNPLVRVTFRNETDRYMKLILTGASVYVFTFNQDQDKTYTITKTYVSASYQEEDLTE